VSIVIVAIRFDGRGSISRRVPAELEKSDVHCTCDDAMIFPDTDGQSISVPVSGNIALVCPPTAAVSAAAMMFAGVSGITRVEESENVRVIVMPPNVRLSIDASCVTPVRLSVAVLPTPPVRLLRTGPITPGVRITDSPSGVP
jgi:hypothetical protein